VNLSSHIAFHSYRSPSYLLRGAQKQSMPQGSMTKFHKRIKSLINKEWPLKIYILSLVISHKIHQDLHHSGNAHFLTIKIGFMQVSKVCTLSAYAPQHCWPKTNLSVGVPSLGPPPVGLFL